LTGVEDGGDFGFGSERDTHADDPVVLGLGDCDGCLCGEHGGSL